MTAPDDRPVTLVFASTYPQFLQAVHEGLVPKSTHARLYVIPHAEVERAYEYPVDTPVFLVGPELVRPAPDPDLIFEALSRFTDVTEVWT